MLHLEKVTYKNIWEIVDLKVFRSQKNFVADLLRAMGYRATVSPQGGDSGIDITAYKDELPHVFWFK